ncbi:MAG TPA: IPT/TIG domain-containing protein [Anaeromyxobacter sp.]|nr:IPT/TIG domain-containing protein [Anaeromyxobacter sp.]
MSTSVHRPLRQALLLSSLLAALGCGGGGGGSSPSAPAVTSITPSKGFSGNATAVTITGDNFLFSPTSSRIRAWLDGTELTDTEGKPGSVTRLDVHTLKATVPAGLSAGKKTLVVENAYGRQGSLANAFTVESLAEGALSATVTPNPATASVGQTVSLTATVQNTGSGTVAAIVPNQVAASSTDGAAGSVTGPDPASVATLAPGDTATFTWQVVLTAAGHLDLAVSAAGSDVFSGLEVASPPVTGSVLVQVPAGLVATISPSRPTVDVGQTVTLDFMVTNGGEAAANVTGVTPSGVAGCGTVTVTPAVSVASPAVIPSGSSRSFSWTCTPSAAGTLTLSGTAVGTDANSGKAVSATPATSATVAVQTAAAITASILVVGNPTSASVGQPLTVQVTVNDTGGASADVSPPTLTPTGSTAACGGFSPATPQTVAGGTSVLFTTTCTPATSGSLGLFAGVSGSDDNTGAVLSAGATLSPPIAVQQPPGLVVTVGANHSTVDAGQSVTLTYTVGNGGGATANGVTVTPAVSGTVTPGCGTVAPGATNIASGGSQQYTLVCAPTGAGSLVVGGTAAGTDANSGSPVTATTITSATVNVETPAGLGAVLSVDGSPTTVDVGQAVTARLTVSDTGGASATVSAVATTPSGVCASASPAPPQTVTPGGPVTFTFSCTPSSAGTLTPGATVTGSDVNSGTALSASASLATPITVDLPTALTATATASAATVDVGQSVTVTFTVTNGGGAAANGVSVTPSVSGAGGTCGSATPTTANVGAGLSQTYSWTCTGASAGTMTLSGTANGTDAVSSQKVTATPASAASVSVQAAAALSAAISVDGSPTTASVGQALTVRFTVTDTGGASATVSSVTPSPAAICSAATPSPPQTAVSGAPAAFSWTCTPSTAGALTLSASTAGTDTNTGSALSASASLASPITVQLPSALTATVAATPTTVDVAENTTVSFTVTNGGGAQADGVTVTPSVSGAGGSCGSASPGATNIPSGGSQIYTWTCAGGSSGTLTLGGNASGTDHNSGNPVSASPATSASVTVQSPAALTASLAATPTQVSVGQGVSLTLTVNNTGQASAQVTKVIPSSSSGAATCPTGPTQTLPVTLSGGTSLSFTWTCTGASGGSATLGASVSGNDANNASLALSAAPTGVPVTVQSAASLSASLSATPTTISVGQTTSVTLTLNNTGQASAQVTKVTPSSSTGAATCPTVPTQTLPVTIAGGTSTTLTWTCTGASGGTPSLGASVSYDDENNPATTLTATPTALPVTVQSAALLSASLAAAPTTLSVGQTTSVTLTLTNNGGASAQVTKVTPSSSTGAATCPTGPTQTLPVTIAAGGSTPLTWTCTGASAGSPNLGASVSYDDVNDPSTTLTATPAVLPVTVLSAPSLTASVATDRSQVDSGQGIIVTLTVNNSGGTAANVTSVSPSASGAGMTAASCGSPSQSSFTVAAGGGIQKATWTCTPPSNGSGTASLGATLTASNATSPTISPASVTVQSPASLTGVLSAVASAHVGEGVLVTLTLTNSGAATANVTALTPTFDDGTCGAPSPAPTFSAPAGITKVTWTCTPAAASPSASLGVGVTASDLNTAGDVSPTVSAIGLAVTNPLTGTLGADVSSITTGAVGGDLVVTLQLSSTGVDAIDIGTATLSVSGAAAADFTCAATPDQALPVSVGAGGSQSLTWTCPYNGSGSSGDPATLGVTVGATDHASSVNVSPTVSGVGVTLP